MSQPPQGEQGPQSGWPPQGQGPQGQAPQGQGPQAPQGQGPQAPQGQGPQGQGPQGQAPQGYPPQAGRPGQPPYPPQGYPQQGYPQQGYPPQGYPQQPYAGGPQPYRPGQGQPGQGQPGQGQPGQGQPGQGPKKKHTGLFVLIGAGALALVLAVVAIAVNVGGRTESGSTSGGGAGSGAAPVAAKPSDAVRGFLEAVAANDAQRALAYVYEPPSDTTFLTNEALQASSKVAALTDISVPDVSQMSTDGITASFSLGGKPYSRKFTPFRDGDAWKLYDGISQVSVGYQQAKTLPMILNGTKVTTDEVYLAPGTYVFSSGSKYVSYGSASTLTVAAQSVSLPSSFKPTLTKAGSKAAVAKTRAAFNACLDKHKLKPKGCPNHIDRLNGLKVEESTVRWRVTKDPFRNARFDLDYSDPSFAEGTFTPDYRIKFKGSENGRSGTVDSEVTGLSTFKSIVDLSKETVSVKLEG